MNRRDRRAEAAQRRRSPVDAPADTRKPLGHAPAAVADPLGSADRARQVLERLGAEQREATIQLLGTGASPDAVVRACARAHVHAQASSEQLLRQDSRIACREGCPWCCHLRVSSTSLEVLGIAAWIRSELSAAQVQDVRRRARALAEETAGMTRAERRPRPCPLLDDGRCMAYQARPLACRGWNSYDPAPCRAYVEGQADATADVNERLILLSQSLRRGLEEGARARDLDGATVDFAVALSLALEDPAVMAQWLDGAHPFASAHIATEGAPGKRRLGIVP